MLVSAGKCMFGYRTFSVHFKSEWKILESKLKTIQLVPEAQKNICVPACFRHIKISNFRFWSWGFFCAIGGFCLIFVVVVDIFKHSFLLVVWEHVLFREKL